MLLAERKVLPPNWEARRRVRPKANFQFRQRELELNREGGGSFRLILRQNAINQLDFSIILTLKDSDGLEYVLRRHNGRHPSEHTNKLEKRLGQANSCFRNAFHIHMATERYQLAGLDIDGYAEITTAYSSFQTALDVMIGGNGFIPSAGEERTLFDFEDEEN
ncbi:MAG: hypothetical protein ACRD4P_08175 [Bryobacteraceae bacterium]